MTGQLALDLTAPPHERRDLDHVRAAVVASRERAELRALAHAPSCRCGRPLLLEDDHCCKCGREVANGRRGPQ